MTRMIVLLSLVVVQLGAANSPGVTPAPPRELVATTLWCDTPLCKGLVGSAAGVAGLTAIGAVTAALAVQNEAQKKTSTSGIPFVPRTTTKPGSIPTTKPGSVPEPGVITTSGEVNPNVFNITTSDFGSMNFRLDEEKKGSNWLVPLLLGLLALCLILAVVGYFLMNKKSKPKVKKAAPVATESRDLELAPPAEVAPLMGGHWEQPMQMVPVTTATTSYTPSYTPAVAPAYSMAAPAYAMPSVVERVAPTYAMASSSYVPAVSGTYPYAAASTAVV